MSEQPQKQEYFSNESSGCVYSVTGISRLLLISQTLLNILRNLHRFQISFLKAQLYLFSFPHFTHRNNLGLHFLLVFQLQISKCPQETWITDFPTSFNIPSPKLFSLKSEMKSFLFSYSAPIIVLSKKSKHHFETLHLPCLVCQ